MSDPEHDLPRMPTDQFRHGGFLSEANRQFFHPLGLALEAGLDGLSVIDGRDDPEGWIFDEKAMPIIERNARHIAVNREKRDRFRLDTLGWIVQPVEADKSVMAVGGLCAPSLATYLPMISAPRGGIYYPESAPPKTRWQRWSDRHTIRERVTTQLSERRLRRARILEAKARELRRTSFEDWLVDLEAEMP